MTISELYEQIEHAGDIKGLLLSICDNEILRLEGEEKDLGWETVTEKDREIKGEERVFNSAKQETIDYLKREREIISKI